MPVEPRRTLLTAFQAALDAVNGRTVVRQRLQGHAPPGPLSMLAIGKAACAMARGAHDVLGTQIADALVITRHGHAEALPWPVLEAGHPLPDEASLLAGERLFRFVSGMPESRTVLVLLSGGASSLLESLPPDRTLTDLRRLNAWLLGSGLDIHAVNAVRQRLSRIKGGRLAQRLYPRPVLCLAISDVPGDDPASIGSGPLTPARIPLDVRVLPDDIQEWLAQASPLPRAEDPCFAGVQYEIVASNAGARAAAARAAEASGWRALNLPGLVQGDAATAGRRLVQALQAEEVNTVCIWGGETTVILPASPGRGGRCQTLALAAAQEIAGRDDTWLLAAGTDGRDGSGEEAGALVDGGTLTRGETEGLDAGAALAGADAGRFLEASGDLVQTGPTGTNVMDLVIGLRLPT